jgi:hypothetical protein
MVWGIPLFEGLERHFCHGKRSSIRRKSADGKIICFEKGKPFYLSRVLPGANKKNDSFASFATLRSKS